MKTHVIILFLILQSIVSNAQQSKVPEIFEKAISGSASRNEIALISYSFRSTIDNQKDLESILNEIFAPEAAIVAGGRKDMLSVSTIGAIRKSKISEDAIDIADVVKPGMSIYDLVWKIGESESRSVAITSNSQVVYDNIGSRYLSFLGMAGNKKEFNEINGLTEGDSPYAEKTLIIFVSGPFIEEYTMAFQCTASYTDNIIWDVHSTCIGGKGTTPGIEEPWSIVNKVSGLAGGKACPDYAACWEYAITSKDVIATINGKKYLIPKAEYSDKGTIQISPKDITYKGEISQPAKGAPINYHY